MKTWLVYRLTPEADDVGHDTLVAELRRALSAPEVQVLEGYALVGSIARRPVEHPYVAGLLRGPSGAPYQMTDTEVRRLAKGPLMRRGALVRVVAGPWRGLTGRLGRVGEYEVTVRIVLRSQVSVVTLSREEVERA